MPAEFEIGPDDTTISPRYSSGEPIMVPYNRCDACGRSDWTQLAYYSIESAIEAGLLVPIEKP
jgi:hypothetical protein